MEMRVTGKRIGGAVKQTAVTKKTESGGLTKTGKSRQDRLEISRKAADFLTEQAKRMAEEIGKMGEKEKDGEENASMFDSYKKQLDMMNKCAKISASISAGDRVPPEDLKYLKEHDMNAYRLAMVTRKPKRNPEDRETVLSEEDLEEMRGNSSESGGTAAAEVSGGEGAGPA